MRKIVAILGDAVAEKGSEKYELAYKTGKALVDAGYRVASGGMGGVMRAAFEGAHASEKYREGDTLAILPSLDRNKCNEYVDIAIPTGMDVLRNPLNANADAVIVIGGGAGTLQEAAYAWTFLRLIVAYRGVYGWSSKIADTRIDDRIRYPEIPDDKVWGADTPEEALKIINEKVDQYNRYFNGISAFDPKMETH